MHPMRPVRDSMPDLGDHDGALSVRGNGRLMDGDRRKMLRFMGKGSVLAAFVAQIGAAGRAFFPNVLYEPPTRFKLKRPGDYPDGYTFNEAHRLFAIRQKAAFHVISAILHASRMHRAVERHRVRLSMPRQPLPSRRHGDSGPRRVRSIGGRRRYRPMDSLK